MENVYISIIFVGLVLGMIPLWLTARFRSRVMNLSKTLYPRPRGRVALILPCKGIDQGLKDNLRAFFRQDYQGIDLVFSVATEDDPAVAEIEAIVDEMKGLKDSRLVIAGIENVRAQKITNLLKAVESVGDSADILVFMDSDLRPDAGFIRRLISPLRLPQVGATTGYQWYAPPTPALGSLLRSIWNAGALTFMADPHRNFCSGAATAIRRETFERARLAEVWDRTLSDDLTLALEVRKLGLETRFVPSCVGVTYESSTLAQTIEYTNRQSVISKVYMPYLWWGAAIGHSLNSFIVCFGLVNLLLGNALGAAVLLTLPLQWINALWLLEAVERILPSLKPDLRRLRWRYVFTASLAPFMSLINTLNSLFTRRITWRGITYEMRSPRETIVLTPTLSVKNPEPALNPLAKARVAS